MLKRNTNDDVQVIYLRLCRKPNGLRWRRGLLGRIARWFPRMLTWGCWAVVLRPKQGASGVALSGGVYEIEELKQLFVWAERGHAPRVIQKHYKDTVEAKTEMG